MTIAIPEINWLVTLVNERRPSVRFFSFLLWSRQFSKLAIRLPSQQKMVTKNGAIPLISLVETLLRLIRVVWIGVCNLDQSWGDSFSPDLFATVIYSLEIFWFRWSVIFGSAVVKIVATVILLPWLTYKEIFACSGVFLVNEFAKAFCCPSDIALFRDR